MSGNVRRMFVGMPLTSTTQDLYLVRSSIEKALRNALPHLHGEFLDVGCGEQPYRKLLMAAPAKITKYIGLDLHQNESASYERARPDITWNGEVIPLPDGSVDSAMATEVLEHCPEPARVLSEIFRVLRPGGALFLTVPFLWPLHDVPYDEFRYTPFALQRLLKNAGYNFVEVRPMGGWNASMAQMIGLYVMRAPMHPRKRRLLKMMTFPIVKRLIRSDREPDVMTNPMITGLWALARK
jgi:ubiquinone/menaquinone biosynthesis C-methylase UbiE